MIPNGINEITHSYILVFSNSNNRIKSVQKYLLIKINTFYKEFITVLYFKKDMDGMDAYCKLIMIIM